MMGKIRKLSHVLEVAVIVAAIILSNAHTVNAANNKKSQKNTVNSVAGIPSTVPSNMNQAYARGIYHVAQDGTGDFTTITAAAVSVPSGSTLIIHEGIYNEALIIQNKIINMKGVSRDKCIIQYDTANYAFVPLNIAAGTYDNLTIKGYHNAQKLGQFSGYAIHIDCDSLTGQTVTFNNCNIISENAFCVGIGLRKYAKITFRGCVFNAQKQGFMLFHDSQNPALAGKASLNIENCVIYDTAEKLLVTQCISSESTTSLTLKNNIVFGTGDEGCVAFGSFMGDTRGWLGAGNVFLSPSSAGNNIMSFNYSNTPAVTGTPNM